MISNTSQWYAQRKGWGANMKINRKVYIVMAHNLTLKSTYISEVCSSKKKAEDHKDYISKVMEKHDPANVYVHWVYDQRVV
jgi:hypothetical protein